MYILCKLSGHTESCNPSLGPTDHFVGMQKQTIGNSRESSDIISTAAQAA